MSFGTIAIASHAGLDCTAFKTGVFRRWKQPKNAVSSSSKGGVRIRPAARIVVLVLAASLAGCGTLPRNPVPPALTASATIPDLPEVRAWAGQPSPAMERDLAQSFDQESRTDFPRGPDGLVRYPHLAVSGGGANGAFGAGFLNGWTATGTRPVFKIVTGVSTGALIAPFALLGPKYDDAIREFYTTTSTRDIFALGWFLLQLLRGEALADTAPLAALIARHVDEEFLGKVAEAHARGRRLYMATVDLDSQQFVVWNMGLIAGSGRPEALELFRKVMLASASIPVAFPPVFFEVEVGGRRYDEMHVDGAVAANIFLSGAVFRFPLVHDRGGRGAGREDIFVIHNGKLSTEPSPVARSVRAIATRALEASLRAGVVGDLIRIYAMHGEANFHWVTIAESVELQGAEVFDPVKMRELYEIGYQAARAGPKWEVRPPGIRRAQPAP
jgi:predicted acylesterase/phospholipase RssA